MSALYSTSLTAHTQPGEALGDELSLYAQYNQIFEVVRADTQALKEETYRLRYQVYCVENPFEDPAHNPTGMEMDAFDERSVHYLLRHRASGMVVGTVRMILPEMSALDRSFPIQSVCDIAALKDPAHVAKTGEISRFCISQVMRKRVTDSLYAAVETPDDERRGNNGRRVVQYAALGLIRGCIEVMQERGIADAYLVCEPTLNRILGMLGVCSTVVGPKVEYHGIRQPVRVSDREVLTNTLYNHPDIWEVLSDGGRLDIYR